MHAKPPKSLQAFQKNYSQYLRNPEQTPLPAGIAQPRSRVYETLLFNNIRSFIDKCFPVARTLIDNAVWLTLCRDFYAHAHCATPIFSYIPQEFAHFIAGRAAETADYPWLAELLHYEWLELEVELHQASLTQTPVSALNVDVPLTLNPTLMVQAYQWPVHRIDTSFIPQAPQSTLLCVYRTAQMQVKFMEINAVTAELLQLFREQSLMAPAALDKLEAKLSQFSAAQIQRFGMELIAQFAQKQILLPT